MSCRKLFISFNKNSPNNRIKLKLMTKNNMSLNNLKERNRKTKQNKGSLNLKKNREIKLSLLNPS